MTGMTPPAVATLAPARHVLVPESRLRLRSLPAPPASPSISASLNPPEPPHTHTFLRSCACVECNAGCDGSTPHTGRGGGRCDWVHHVWSHPHGVCAPIGPIADGSVIYYPYRPHSVSLVAKNVQQSMRKREAQGQFPCKPGQGKPKPKPISIARPFSERDIKACFIRERIKHVLCGKA